MSEAPDELRASVEPKALPRPERLVILGALALIIALAWIYLATFEMATPTMSGMSDMGDMPDMPGMDGMAMAPMSFGLLAAMWIVMMIGMMLPSASPMIVMAARLTKAREPGNKSAFSAGAFALGYLLVWSGFSLIAAAAQVALQEGVLSGEAMAIRSGPIAGGVLIAAGLYQWTPLKQFCLTKCRSPVGFFVSQWRAGRRGALLMGARHGAFCLGCCWLLMALLFVAGVMALPWVAAVAALVLLEKIAPKGEWIARVGGALMVGAGLYVIVAG